MRTLAAIPALLLSLAACGGKDEPAPKPPPSNTSVVAPNAPPKTVVDQTTPEALAESIFAAARSGDLASLEVVLAPKDADGDAKNVAHVASAPAKKQEEFKAYFSTGKVNGEVKVEGDKAAVPILFGPDGKKPETLNMVRVDGKWFLQSF